VEQIIKLVEALPWQIGLLLCVLWLGGLSFAVYRRSSQIPLKMVTRLVGDFQKHRDLVHKHAQTLVGNEGRLVGLERARDRVQEGQSAILDRLRDIDIGLAGVKGYAEGKRNGKAAHP